MLPDDGCQFKSVHVGHAYIHEDHGHVGLEQNIESLAGGGRLDQVLSQLGKNHLIAQELARLVVDHENVCFLVRRHSSLSLAPVPVSFPHPPRSLPVQPHAQR